jgi:Eco57I restriction-modification methylase
VQTLRLVAERIAAVRSLDDLATLAATFGCDGAPAPLDVDTRRALGLGAEVLDVRVARGTGALRALLVELRPATSLRESLTRLAARLQQRTPHLLWMLLAIECDGAGFALAAWSDERRPPRVAALVADRARVIDSDADTVRALQAVREAGDLLVHARWVELLGREALSRRFYATLERVVRDLARSASVGTDAQRDEIALLYVSRALFLAFLEAKGWLDGDRDFLVHAFDRCMQEGGNAHRRLLLPLFFGTLNTPVRNRASAARRFGAIPFLNGGLFARAPVERLAKGLRFPDETLGALLGDLLTRYRFTAREESIDLSEVAIDPEMLGRAFESLMASRERRASGAFYTPFALVDRITTTALEHALVGRLGPWLARKVIAGEVLDVSQQTQALAALGSLRVLDPACGSGAFLVHCMERLGDLMRRAGDLRSTSVIRRDVLTRCIFGVDVNPTAVWLCELRLWLSVVIEATETDPRQVEALPNLDRNVRVGDTLAGRAFAGSMGFGARSSGLGRLRERYARATGVRKQRLARELDRRERRLVVMHLDNERAALGARRRELSSSLRSRDLFGDRRRVTSDERAELRDLRRRMRALHDEQRRLENGGALPFSFAAHFAEVNEIGGFAVVIGNPPWVRPHRLPARQRLTLRESYVVARTAAWLEGAARARAGRGFAAQVDFSALFVERSLRLLAPDGVLALLLPSKLWCSLAGGGVRRLLADETHILALEDYSEASWGFDAVTYPSLLAARRVVISPERTAHVVTLGTVRRGVRRFCWRVAQRALAFDDSPGAPWLLLPREVREAFDRVSLHGEPLAESAVGRPLLGVKCGCNAAFVVKCTGVAGSLAEVVGSDGRRGTIEAEHLKPVLRGEGLAPWHRAPVDELIVWTHDAKGTPMRQLPPSVAAWLAPWRHDLSRRADARRTQRWWTLFRTDGARNDRPRVAWADVGKTPRAVVIEAGDPIVPLNSCYVSRCRDETDALALAAWLNAPIARAWLAALAEPARGGYHRYLGWTVSLLPLPKDWARARLILRTFAESACSGRVPGDSELLDGCLDALGLRRRHVAPLLAWIEERQ